MKLRSLLGIKTTKHRNYYRLYFLWLPFMKVRFKGGTTKVYLFGVQVAHVKTIYSGIISAGVNCDDKNVAEELKLRALEIIADRLSKDYIDGVK